MSAFLLREAVAADNPALLRLLGVPQPSRGIWMTFERAPDYFHSVAVTHERPHVLVAERRADGEIVGVASVGSRRLFVNGRVQDVRYGSDLRIATGQQGSRLMIYIARAVRELLQEQGWYQAIILEENQRTRAVLEGARVGMPRYRPHVGITTWTLSSRQRRAATSLQARIASLADVPAMNAFLARMADHYQFLPVYDFAAIAAGHGYFKGLGIEDFLLVSDTGGLRGMVALWNQKSFKQTRVVAYDRLMAWVRPFYNAWAVLSGGFRLPPAGDAFDYRVLHSLLTAPKDREAMDALLDAAWDTGRQRGAAALTLTLADSDPRAAALARFRSVRLRGRHYTVAFNDAAHPHLDPLRIPFFECGRL